MAAYIIKHIVTKNPTDIKWKKKLIMKMNIQKKIPTENEKFHSKENNVRDLKSKWIKYTYI